MKRPAVRIEHQRQEEAVAFPQRQFEYAIHIEPLKRSFRVSFKRRACVGCDSEDEAEPVLAAFPEAGPIYGPAYFQRRALDASLLADLSLHPRDHLFEWIELAAEAVVLAEVQIIRPGVAVDEQ